MPNYDWRAWDDQPWRIRYPIEAIGAETWVGVFSESPDRSEMRTWIAAAQELKLVTRPEMKRVFISHRKADIAMARQAAEMARRIGCEYWLDVEDPTLTWLTQNTVLDAATRATAIASTIEMALLNCSHVLAVITRNTQGSMWVPYEYGRVKDRAVVQAEAACWTQVHPADTTMFADYLHLGTVAQTQADVTAWLQA